MANWSKLRQQIESYIAPSLEKRVKYTATSYRMAPDKTGKACITVDGIEVFQIKNTSSNIRWYQAEQEIIKDDNILVTVTEEEIDQVRKESGDKIPEERLEVIARKRKTSETAKKVFASQGVLLKTDFYGAVNRFLSTSIDRATESDEIILNIFAILDRRVGKNRLRKMKKEVQSKHPIVQYFYELRCCAEQIK